MKYVKLFEQFINEGADFTVDDSVQFKNASYEKEEKALAQVMKYLGAKTLADLYIIGDAEESDWSQDKTIKISGSSLYDNTVGLGELMGTKAVPAASVKAGSNTLFLIGPKSTKMFK